MGDDCKCSISNDSLPEREVNSYEPEELENPLLWPIWELIQSSAQSWKIHGLAERLLNDGILQPLDNDSTKDLFKRNFLMMNALYQLQESVYSDQWLQVEAMDIQLMERSDNKEQNININHPLREYYLDWSHYEATAGEVKQLLNEFWSRYRQHTGQSDTNIDSKHALRVFGLPENATKQEIRKRWRQLAMKWHPDRHGGDGKTFHKMCAAWNVLR